MLLVDFGTGHRQHSDRHHRPMHAVGLLHGLQVARIPSGFHLPPLDVAPLDPRHSSGRCCTIMVETAGGDWDRSVHGWSEKIDGSDGCGEGAFGKPGTPEQQHLVGIWGGGGGEVPMQ